MAPSVGLLANTSSGSESERLMTVLRALNFLGYGLLGAALYFLEVPQENYPRIIGVFLSVVWIEATARAIGGTEREQ